MSRLTLAFADTSFSPEAGLYLDNARDLAFSDTPAEAAREVLGVDSVTFPHPASETQGFVGRGNGFAVLAFRGCEQLNLHPKDWLTNFQACDIKPHKYRGEWSCEIHSRKG
ncbi:MAG TPA: hypothetical protein VH092_32195 [Urbifossiella sp.]|nr:hypothetical protein [Urbifossiella sp.]